MSAGAEPHGGLWTMSDAVFILALLAAWILLQAWLLPKLGVST